MIIQTILPIIPSVAGNGMVIFLEPVGAWVLFGTVFALFSGILCLVVQFGHARREEPGAPPSCREAA